MRLDQAIETVVGREPGVKTSALRLWFEAVHSEQRLAINRLDGQDAKFRPRPDAVEPVIQWLRIPGFAEMVDKQVDRCLIASFADAAHRE